MLGKPYNGVGIMLLTQRDIAIIVILALFAILFFIIKQILKKDVVVIKDVPGGRLGKIISHLEEDGFKYVATIDILRHSFFVDEKEYEVIMGRNVAIFKKGFRKYALRIRSTKTAGKSITSTLIRYPIVELGYYGYDNIIFYDYERSKYRLVKLNNTKIKTFKAVTLALAVCLAILTYFYIR